MKRLLLALFLVACSPEPEPAPVEAIHQAVVNTYVSPIPAPYGSVAILGSNNGQWLVFWHPGTGNCTWHNLGPVSGMTAGARVESGTASWADMRALGNGVAHDVQCSGGTFGAGFFQMGNLAQNGQSVYLHGTAGADYMFCTGKNGNGVGCYGYGGNDILEDYGNPEAGLQGGDGDDKLRATSLPWPSNVSMYGEGGNDCLYKSNTGGNTDCGSGSDTTNVSGGFGCETVTATTCP